MLKSVKYNSEFDLDDPQRTMQHGEIIKSKPFLRKIYLEWYRNFTKELKNLPEGKILEIGSGGGFLKEVIPQVITSDILPLSNCDMTFSAEDMPFGNEELSAIFMINVLHHIKNPEKFLTEVTTKLKPGGMMILIEPANTIFGSFIYRNFHHEPFDVKAGWEIPGTGPMSESNQALPYILFERDRVEYEKKFPRLKIQSIRFHTPFGYILSGGVSRRTLVPDFSFSFFKYLEKGLTPFMKIIGLFETVKIRKI